MRPIGWTCLFLSACARGSDGDHDVTGPIDPDLFRLDWALVREEDPRALWRGVWGSAVDDVWIVGAGEDGGVVLRGDGDDLSEVALPPGTPGLRAIDGSGPRGVWVGGDDGALLWWDGKRWRSPVEVPGVVRGLDVAAPDDVLIVGGDEDGPPQAWHWDGDQLTTIALDRAPAGAVLEAVTRVQGVGIGVGRAGLIVDLATGARRPSGRTDDLWDVDAVGTIARVAGGSASGFLGRVEAEGLVIEATTISPLRAVDDLGQGLVVVAGERGVEGVFDARVAVFREVDPFTLQPVLDVWVSAAGDAWAVGGRAAGDGDVARGFVGLSRGPG